jgi:hypothetical protein
MTVLCLAQLLIASGDPRYVVLFIGAGNHRARKHLRSLRASGNLDKG